MFHREPWRTERTAAAAWERPASSIRSDRGFTLVEVLAAVALISIGVAATLKVFGAAGHSVLRSERTDVAVHQGQAELDRLRTLRYGQLAMRERSVRPRQPRRG
jgi:prepilin-type N-terminal cleavage/methylation domain-containing protein